MLIRWCVNRGVPCVPCAPDSLETSFYKAFRDGTPNANNRNTSCAEHVWCSANAVLVGGDASPHLEVMRRWVIQPGVAR